MDASYMDWLLPKITEALYSSLPHSHFCLASHHSSHYQTKWANHWYSRGWGVWQAQRSKRQGGRGVPSVGGIEYFQDRHIWTYGDLDSAMLVKYSISETPCCFVYFIFINRKFALQYPQVSSHNLRCKFNFETDTQFNINWSNVATCSTKLMFNSVSYMYHVKCCWIEQGSISYIQQVGIS